MKNIGLVSLFVFFMLAVAAFALVPDKLIENFERNLDLKTPEWWKFDNVNISVVKNPAYRPGDTIAKQAGKYSLSITGNATNWYCGGIGTYLGVDASSYTGITLDIYGYGDGSGNFKLEVYDDDKGSYQTLYDKTWIPVKDDIWATTVSVDWKGWKEVYIPFSSFKLQNKGRGDGIMNLDQDKSSGGLLQLQFVFLAGAADGDIKMNFDNLRLVNRTSSADDE